MGRTMSSLARGDALPHFVVTTTSGERVEYKTIWQHRMAVLLVLPREPGRLGAYADDLLRSCAEAAPEAACIATRDIVPGLPAPALVVTDQWGEIDTLISLDERNGLPSIADVIGTVEHLRARCPECEGEAR